jgi:hypothetical protein
VLSIVRPEQDGGDARVLDGIERREVADLRPQTGNRRRVSEDRGGRRLSHLGPFLA